LLLGAAEALVGEPHRALPDLALLGAIALAPMAIGTRVVNAPGAAAAVCGAYLLPRSLISVWQPQVEPPPMLLAPAIAFELALWLRGADIGRLLRALRLRKPRWRKRPPPVRRRTRLGRAAAAGALFGLSLAVVEPPFAVLLGADSTTWSGNELWAASALTVLLTAIVGMLSVPDTAS
jgi:hypothetical protein